MSNLSVQDAMFVCENASKDDPLKRERMRLFPFLIWGHASHKRDPTKWWMTGSFWMRPSSSTIRWSAAQIATVGERERQGVLKADPRK
jgi:hypothetical protein